MIEHGVIADGMNRMMSNEPSNTMSLFRLYSPKLLLIFLFFALSCKTSASSEVSGANLQEADLIIFQDGPGLGLTLKEWPHKNVVDQIIVDESGYGKVWQVTGKGQSLGIAHAQYENTFKDLSAYQKGFLEFDLKMLASTPSDRLVVRLSALWPNRAEYFLTQSQAHEKLGEWQKVKIPLTSFQSFGSFDLNHVRDPFVISSIDSKPFKLLIDNLKITGGDSQPNPRPMPQPTEPSPAPNPHPGTNPTPADPSQLEPLYGVSTPKDPPVARLVDGVAYTNFGARVRSRHAREAEFRLYRVFPPFYFENRTFEVEVIDQTGAGGQQVTINVTLDHPIGGDPPQKLTGRFFYSGYPSKAGYYHGGFFKDVSQEYSDKRFHYRFVVDNVHILGLPPEVKKGQLMEMEFTFNLARENGVGSDRGASNYYSRSWLIRLGEPGVLAWDANGGFPEGEWHPENRPNGSHGRDSLPLSEKRRLGGDTTISADLSNEPEKSLMQMAQNIAPKHAQVFVEGRRLLHTSFLDGNHTEGGNEPFKEMQGKAGPSYDQPHCVGCHLNNGRSARNDIGQSVSNIVFKTGVVSEQGKIAPHPEWGRSIETQSTEGAPESRVTLEGYEEISGSFDDGARYVLKKPRYKFHVSNPPQLVTPLISPPLIGMGLLEAIDEESIRAYADPDDRDGDGISGRMSVIVDLKDRKHRLGRFGWKATRVSIHQQVAGAFSGDMGVSSPLFPEPNGQTEVDDMTIHKISTYLSVLGVPPRRNSEATDVLEGEKLFKSAQCSGCHIPQMRTSSFHPFAELREQTIYPYTDLLLHDMGSDLAGDLPGESASASEWRTPPLWGLGLAGAVSNSKVSYLHDGRATTIAEAILWHGGEAANSRDRFKSMTSVERGQLVNFLRSL